MDAESIEGRFRGMFSRHFYDADAETLLEEAWPRARPALVRIRVVSEEEIEAAYRSAVAAWKAGEIPPPWKRH